MTEPVQVTDLERLAALRSSIREATADATTLALARRLETAWPDDRLQARWWDVFDLERTAAIDAVEAEMQHRGMAL
jgi:nitrate reductase assembly molybdenum cofactor insertion protein NarJ